MYKRGLFRFLRDKDLSCSVVEIGYVDGSVAWFILPDKGKLEDVEHSLGKENLERWRMSFQYRDIKLWLPKVTISASFDVKDSFRRLRVTNVFDSFADLSGITGKCNLKVTESNYKSQMMVLLYLSLLLIGIEFHCYHLIGPLQVQTYYPYYQYPSSEDECNSTGDAWHKVVPFNADFAFRLYKQMASNQTNKNVFFSPLSLSLAFAMLALGAKSETQSQIYKGLAFNLSEIEEKEIHGGLCQLIHRFNSPKKELMKIGNVLFLENSLKMLPKFLEDAETFYQAEAFNTNFLNPTAAKQQINDCIKNNTHGKTVDTVRDLSVHTVMVLVNYIYFKDYWIGEFNPALTEEDFFAHGNKTVRLHFMHRWSRFKFFHDEDLSCSVVEVPYVSGSVAWFVLPDKGKLKDVESSLTKEILERWRISFQSRRIKLWLPKFSISASLDVRDSLHRLGITNVFNSHADLSGITGKCNLRVTEAVHKAMLVVQEDGFELTQGGVDTSKWMKHYITLPNFPPPLHIKFNRPFLIFIIDASKGTIILMGKIVSPIEQ